MADPDLHRRASELVAELNSREPDEREEVLRGLGEQDPRLAQEVSSLLAVNHDDRVRLDESIAALKRAADRITDSIHPDTILIPGFHIQEQIGTGAWGTVYRAIQNEPRRPVAIKLLRSVLCVGDHVDRFIAEAHVLARLEHPMIARIYEIGFVETAFFVQPYIVMELVHGEPVTGLVARLAMPVRDRLELISDLCEAVGYAHERGVIHRDIKPANVLGIVNERRGRAHIKLIDFGIAKVIGETTSHSPPGTTGTTPVGTIPYMSPERVSGESSGSTVASDIYSLGRTAIEILESGRRTDGSRATDMNNRMLVSARRVFDRMIDPVPERRPPSTREVIDALRQVLDAEHRVPGDTHGIAMSLRHSQIFTCAALVLAITAMAWLRVLHAAGPAARPAASTTRDVALASASAPGIDQHRSHYHAVAPTGATPDEAPTTRSERARRAYEQMGLAVSLSQSGHQKAALSALGNLSEIERDLDSSDLSTLRNAAIAKAFVLAESGQIQLARQQYLDVSAGLRLGEALDEAAAHTWISVAGGLQRCGESERARRMCLELEQHPGYETLSWRRRTSNRLLLAGIHWLGCDYQAAERTLIPVLEEAPDALPAPELDLLSQAYSSLGVFLRAQGRFAEADGRFEQALYIARRMGDPASASVCRIIRNRSLNALLSQDYESAAAWANYCRNVWIETPTGWGRELADVEFVLGSVALATGDLPAAIDALSGSKQRLAARQSTPERFAAVVDNALGAALFASGRESEGMELLRASSSLIAESYGQAHPWAALARDRERPTPRDLP